VNGGWGFHNFELGARVWDDQASEERVFDGIDWVLGGLEVGTNGATTRSRVLTFQHSVGVGGTSTSAEVIPSHAIVHGVTARVVQEVVGSGLTGFSIGVSGSTNRYGAGIGLQQNAWAKGVTGQPVTYYSDEPIVFTAEGGTFTGGEIDVAVHLTELSIPRAI
jgi:hypothetical protein